MTAAAASASEAGTANFKTLLVKSRPAVGGGVVSEMKIVGMPSVKSAVSDP